MLKLNRKTYSIALMVIALSGLLSAQETNLLGDIRSHGGYWAPTLQVTSVNGELAVMSGSRWGWIINHQFVIGSSDYNLITSVEAPGSIATSDVLIAMDYDGFDFEYIFQPDNLIHYSVRTLFAGGHVRYFSESYATEIDSDDDFIYVIEPSMDITLNITRHIRAGLNLGYRGVMDVDLEGLTASDLSGPSATLLIRFGKF